MQSLIMPSHHTRVTTNTPPFIFINTVTSTTTDSSIEPMATATFNRPSYTTTPHFQYNDQHAGDRDKLTTYPYHQQGQGQGQSSGKIISLLALLPVTGILLGLAGLTLVGTVIGLAIVTPLFVIFSPVIVPAILTIGLAVTGFLVSGAFGITGLSSLSYLFNMVRRSGVSVSASASGNMDYVKGKLQDVGEYAGQKTKDFGQKIQDTAHEMGDHGYGVGQDQGHGQAGVHVQVGGKEGRKGGDRS